MSEWTPLNEYFEPKVRKYCVGQHLHGIGNIALVDVLPRTVAILDDKYTLVGRPVAVCDVEDNGDITDRVVHKCLLGTKFKLEPNPIQATLRHGDHVRCNGITYMLVHDGCMHNMFALHVGSHRLTHSAAIRNGECAGKITLDMLKRLFTIRDSDEWEVMHYDE